MDSERIPVIVGVGQINDRPADPADGLDSAALMIRALIAADADAGAGWLAALDNLAIVRQISCPEIEDAGRAVAAGLGVTPTTIHETETASGDGPVLLLDRAANLIGSGAARICGVVGGEALRTAARRKASIDSSGDIVRAASTRQASDFRQRYGLNAPLDVYPLYENAIRAAYRQSLDEAQEESAAIWSRFAEVARDNPHAWLRQGATPQDVATVSPANRLVAFPYTKLMVANSSVNQGAGFLVTSLAEARRRGVPEDRLVYIGHGAAAHEPSDPLARDSYSSSASMAVSIEETLRRNSVSAEELDHVELYSCFPCVPKMARRVLGWPLDRPASVVGGLTFGGGPIGNYMAHAIASSVERLRRGDAFGLLFANGGLATHNHSIILSSKPIADIAFPHDFDVNALADARRGPVPPVAESYAGPATLETFTVPVARDGSLASATIVARTPDGRRTLARAVDPETLAMLTAGDRELVGVAGIIRRDGDDQIWAFKSTVG